MDAHLCAERLVQVCIAIDRDYACARGGAVSDTMFSFVPGRDRCGLSSPGSLTDVDQAFEAVGDLVIVWCEFLAVSAPARQKRRVGQWIPSDQNDNAEEGSTGSGRDRSWWNSPRGDKGSYCEFVRAVYGFLEGLCGEVLYVWRAKDGSVDC